MASDWRIFRGQEGSTLRDKIVDKIEAKSNAYQYTFRIQPRKRLDLCLGLNDAKRPVLQVCDESNDSQYWIIYGEFYYYRNWGSSIPTNSEFFTAEEYRNHNPSYLINFKYGPGSALEIDRNNQLTFIGRKYSSGPSPQPNWGQGWMIKSECIDANLTQSACQNCIAANIPLEECQACSDVGLSPQECQQCADANIPPAKCKDCISTGLTVSKCQQCIDNNVSLGECQACSDVGLSPQECQQCADANIPPAKCKDCISAGLTLSKCQQCIDNNVSLGECQACSDVGLSPQECQDCAVANTSLEECQQCLSAGLPANCSGGVLPVIAACPQYEKRFYSSYQTKSGVIEHLATGEIAIHPRNLNKEEFVIVYTHRANSKLSLAINGQETDAGASITAPKERPSEASWAIAIGYVPEKDVAWTFALNAQGTEWLKPVPHRCTGEQCRIPFKCLTSGKEMSCHTCVPSINASCPDPEASSKHLATDMENPIIQIQVGQKPTTITFKKLPYKTRIDYHGAATRQTDRVKLFFSQAPGNDTPAVITIAPGASITTNQDNFTSVEVPGCQSCILDFHCFSQERGGYEGVPCKEIIESICQVE